MEHIPVVQDCTPPLPKRGKFHVRLTEGFYQNLRRLSSWPLLALFFGLVWVQVDGQPWLLFSFEQRRIFLFGTPYFWQDLPLLAGVLITGAFLLFFTAVGWGRIWCGFACPQSIWTWLFIRIEQFCEGPAVKRIKADESPLTGLRLARRLAKHLLWLTLALLTATTFTGYFVPIREILTAAINLDLSLTLFCWLGIMTLLTYLNAGLVREKICLHACPYSRFQGVMFDQDTFTVSYDSQRGDPRASLRSEASNKGDCVDCGLCVQVCPTGIDIRDGLQAACIDCGACIDACDQVMDKLARPKGLIRFASEAQLQQTTSNMLRPRLVGYGCMMVISLSGVLYGAFNTKTLIVEIQRDRHTLFTHTEAGNVCNSYRMKVESAASLNQPVEVSLQQTDSFKLIGATQLDLSQHNGLWIPYRVCSELPAPNRKALTFTVKAKRSQTEVTKTTTFLSSQLIGQQ